MSFNASTTQKKSHNGAKKIDVRGAEHGGDRNTGGDDEGNQVQQGLNRRTLLTGGAAIFAGGVLTELGTGVGDSIRSWLVTLVGNDEDPVVTGSFEYPDNDETIKDYPTKYSTSGSISGPVPDDSTLWVATRASGESEWHPMREPAVIRDGAFLAPALFLGAPPPQDQERTFALELWLADAEATAVLKRFAERAMEDHSSIPRPQGVEMLQQITVKRG
ncbi:hypothetical protein [Kineococcus glutinatus]|uniref:Twin-arginine translocation signal domain-containing protein n=1 Tax=Kineococcus glutinatus TaxID=1070872 RepID=A0ABP9HJ22_9ACTN